MNLTPLFKRLGMVAAKNSPAILTSIGVTGTVAAAYLAAKGAFEASKILSEAEENLSSEEEVKHFESWKGKAELTWRCYIPAAGCVVLSVTAVICANRISDRRAAAMASAYSVVRESYAEYRAKNKEKIGPKKEQEVRDEIAQDRRDRYPVDQAVLVVTGRGPTLCFDAWNGRYFSSSKNAIDEAVNNLNRDINLNGHASLSDFYHHLGVPAVGFTDYIGWNTDQLLEVEVSGTLDDTGEPCLQLEFKSDPRENFDRSY